jgi:hypothetical protein
MSRLPFEDGDIVCLKVMALYISPEHDGRVQLNRPSRDDSCMFTMVHKGGKSWAFRSDANGKYLSVGLNGMVSCRAAVPLAAETFNLIGSDPRHVLFENQKNSQYLKAKVDPGYLVNQLICSDRNLDGEHFFEIERQ